jgi:16S rRNA C1402 (ribose-2'-O) methylase RsmI
MLLLLLLLLSLILSWFTFHIYVFSFVLGTVSEAYDWSTSGETPRGEFTLVLSAYKPSSTATSSNMTSDQVKLAQEQDKLSEALLKVKELLAGSKEEGGQPWSVSMAVQHVAKEMKLPKRLLYKLAVDRL